MDPDPNFCVIDLQDAKKTICFQSFSCSAYYGTFWRWYIYIIFQS